MLTSWLMMFLEEIFSCKQYVFVEIFFSKFPLINTKPVVDPQCGRNWGRSSGGRDENGKRKNESPRGRRELGC